MMYMRMFFIHSAAALMLLNAPSAQALEAAPVPRASVAEPSSIYFSEIEDAIRSALVERGMDEAVELQQLYVVPLNSGKGMPLNKAKALGITYPLALSDIKVEEQSSRFVALFHKVDGQAVATVSEDAPVLPQTAIVSLEVRGRYAEMVEVPALSKRMRKGDVIAASDIEWISVPKRRIRASSVTEIEKLVGRTPRRVIDSGEIIRISDVDAPKMVERGKPIAIYYRTGAMELRDMGVAMSDGGVGDIIQVKNIRSNTVVQAMVSAPSTATVNYWQQAAK